MAQARKTATKRKAAPAVEENTDVLELLTEDHRNVAQMFDDFEELGDDDELEKQSLAQQICLELSIHATVEEELFYPAAREALGPEGEDLLNEAEVEHGSAKELIAMIMSESSADPLFDARVKVLGEYIRHHVDEEEGELFTLIRDSDLDLEELGAEVMERKEILRSELEEQVAA